MAFTIYNVIIIIITIITITIIRLVYKGMSGSWKIPNVAWGGKSVYMTQVLQQDITIQDTVLL
jgi:hypothetical protein